MVTSQAEDVSIHVIERVLLRNCVGKLIVFSWKRSNIYGSSWHGLRDSEAG